VAATHPVIEAVCGPNALLGAFQQVDDNLATLNNYHDAAVDEKAAASAKCEKGCRVFETATAAVVPPQHYG
jgi:hypothetical protein